MKNQHLLLGIASLLAAALSCNQPVKQPGNSGDSTAAVEGGGTAGTDTSRLGAPAPKEDRPTFRQEVRFRDYKFGVTTKGDGTIRELLIGVQNAQTADTTKSDTTRERGINGRVINVAAADLNGDKKPELYCFTVSDGSGSYGDVYAYTFDSSKAVRIGLPELSEDSTLAAGYMGHDSFYVSKQFLMRSFPVYKKDDPNAAPSGGKRTVKYQLKKQAAGYGLIPVK